MPATLTGVAAAEWKRLVDLGVSMKVLTPADGPALAAVCFAFEELMAARAEVRKSGAYYTTETEAGSVMHRVHPAVAVGADAMRRYTAGLDRFGLTPASRSKVAVAVEETQDEVELWAIQGGKRA